LHEVRIAQRRREYESDFQQIIDQMQRVHEEADVANECYQEVHMLALSNLSHCKELH
jgi:hypothetical protein